MFFDLLTPQSSSIYDFDSNKMRSHENLINFENTLSRPEPEPTTSDFEIGAIDAAKLVWPNSKVLGCWRHLKISFLRNLIKYIYINSKRHYSFIKTGNGYIQFITALDSIINFYKDLNILFRTLAKLIRFYWIQTSDGYIGKLITVSVNDSIYDRMILSLTRGGFFTLEHFAKLQSRPR
ncbi:hypothetical protein L3Y34_009515 [Caenorhabditis briggsae]|uniref:Uncharacterized protein n=1 Tax=Caenorhabditis briggsae TaxID=6238 RepID=A0AAE9D1M5_CAEBR|nr:hypothetical protein L3Y34_009515 [Caenorhabditis briggsae]